MYNMSEGGVLSAYGTTRHCFLNSRTGLPVMMNKEMEDFSRVMQKSLGRMINRNCIESKNPKV